MGDGVANGSVVDLGALDGVHFARFVVLDEATDLRGEPLPASLLYLSDLDVSREHHLGQLVDQSGEGLDQLFGHCEGYPEGRQRTREGRLAYLRAPPDQRAGVLREHRRPHAPPDPRGGRAARLARGLPRRRGRPPGTKAGEDPARRPGARRGRPRRSAARSSRRPGSTSASGCASSRTSSACALLVLVLSAAPAPRRAGLPRPAPPARDAATRPRT